MSKLQNINSEEKRLLLASLLKQKELAKTDLFPLSFAQKRLWFLNQWEPNSIQYNIPTILKITGSLDAVILERCLQVLIQRHESLRTTFVVQNETPMQAIATTVSFSLPRIDLAQMSDVDRTHALNHQIQLVARLPFDLTQGPLLRTTLVQTAPKEHFWLLCMHHIIADIWSIGILIRELSALYRAMTNDQTLSLSELPIQYADYAAWQHEYLTTTINIEKQLEYWRHQLHHVPAQSGFPSDYSRPASPTYYGQNYSFTLPATQVQRLKMLSMQQKTTSFMTFLAIFQVLLLRYSNQKDICIGTPSANRTQKEVEDVIGYFVNMLALRTQISDNPTFTTFLQEIKRTTLEAYLHQEVPFDRIVEEMHPERNTMLTPFFQTVFAFQEVQDPIELPDLQVETLKVETGTAKFDLVLTLEEQQDKSVHATVEFSTALFNASTIQRLAQHFQTLLDYVLIDPECPIFDIPLLTTTEYEQIVHMWNETLQPDKPAHTVPQMFAAQVQCTPHELALIYQQEQLTYQELDDYSNQLAHHLRTLGVGPEVLVAVFMERTPTLLIALLAIMKSGGAYLPLDVAYPSNRIDYMLRDSQATILISHQPLLEQLPAYIGILVDLSTGWQKRYSKSPTHKMSTELDATNLAYLIYTSGSTGQPKGVAITHRNLTNFIYWSQERYAPSKFKRTLAHTSICFDISILEIFTPLCCGGTIILQESLANDTDIHLQEVTFLFAVPSVLREFLKYHALPASLQVLILGGETLPLSLIQQLELPPTTTMLDNLYGPTEGTIVSTAQPIVPEESTRVTLGHPITNSESYILDQRLQPVPIGVIGELYIGGEGVARGYQYRPELTAERFIPHPFSKFSGARLYRTGDLACYLPDGQIDFQGRSDEQVKIRGLRIELGEIAALLENHPKVAHALVVKGQHPTQHECLIAYVIANEIDAQALHSYLSSFLADYMLPATFVFLSTLPLTANGKLDRKQLPEPDWVQIGPNKSAKTPPRTATEMRLVALWRQLLAIEAIGIHDSFFDLGGHSLMATQLMARIQKIFAVHITLHTLFHAITIARQAEEIDALRLQEQQDINLPLKRYERDDTAPLSSAQQRLWFIEQIQTQHELYILPVIIRLSGPVQATLLDKSFQIIISRHEILRTTFQAEAGIPVQKITAHSTFTLGTLDLQTLSIQDQHDQIQQLIQSEILQPFDLAHGPLLRARLVQTEPEQYLLLMSTHHIIFDGWSLGIFIQELTTYYQQLSEYKPIEQLTQLPIQYADYTLWQRDRWQHGEIEPQINYWQEQLKDAPPLLDLPTDYPRPAVPSYRGSLFSFSLPPELLHRAKEFCAEQQITQFIFFCTLFQLLLARYSNQEDISVGIPIAHRERNELENLIGFFVNTLVLRINITGNPTFLALLSQAREVALAAYAHQSVPFEKLLESLQPERSTSYSPLFQVLFSLQNTPQRTLQLPDIHCEWQAIDTHQARFDLSMTLEEQSQGEMQILIEFNTDLFEASTIERLAQHYRTLCEHCLQHPQRSISEISHLSEQERHLLLSTWSSSLHCSIPPQSLHTLFEQQVAETPDALALTLQDEHLTYRELNEQANAIAHELNKRDIRSGMPIGLHIERSFSLIIGIIAILKTGGMYIPIDQKTPDERLRFIVQDTKITLLLTQQSLKATLASSLPQSIELLCLDNMRASQTHTLYGNSAEALKPNQLAYTIYTSGSTGQPKGVAVTHRNVVNLLHGAHRWFTFQTHDVWALFHSPAFDMSVWEIWGALLFGGRLVIVPHDIVRSPLDFYHLLYQEQVTMLNQTPKAFLQLVRTEEDFNLHLPLYLRYVTFGGEALDFQKLQPWFTRHGDTVPQLINLYGITEATVHSTYRPITQKDVEGTQSKMIGKPLPNVELYLLDTYMQPVAIGTVGEIFIGGAGVAQGYLYRPELTAERFITHLASKRLYKSGDLARYHANGDIEYIGRNDQQVKIRGFRIELAEIEIALVKHPAIQQCCVLAQQMKYGDIGLIAYLTLTDNSTKLPPEHIRDFLSIQVPDYMLPTAFVFLEKFPLTNNGKLDRRALLALPWEETKTHSYVAPRTSSEVALQDIWSEVLGIESPGVYDDFFALGGHSLLITQIASRIQYTLKISIPLPLLFTHTTIAEQARWIEEQQTHRVETSLPSLLLPQPRPQVLPLSFAQQRLWFLHHMSPENTAYTIPMAIRLHGSIDSTLLERSIGAIVQRHESLRSCFNSHQGHIEVQILPAMAVPVQHIDLSLYPEYERDQRAQEILRNEGKRPFDLSEGPLMRVVMITHSSAQTDLGLYIHHIIADGWSCQIMLREIVAFYEAYCQGKEASLPKLPLQYVDYALWQHEWFKSTGREAQLAYWKQRFQQLPEPLQLPVDYAQTAIPSLEGDTYLFNFDHNLWQEIQQFSQQAGTTAFMTLLAVFQVLLSRYTGQDRISVGTPIANRTQVSVEPLIGMFVNMLVIYADLTANPTFEDVLQQVKQLAIDAYANQDLPFEKLIQELPIPTNPGSTPLFQVFFAMQTLPAAPIKTHNFTYQEIEVNTGTSKYPLSLYLQEQEQQLRCIVEYNTSLFKKSTLERLMHNYQTVIKAAIETPNRSIALLPVLSQEEQRQILAFSLPPRTAYREDVCIQQLFEEQVQRTPYALAATFDKATQTYEQLNQQANQLAHFLRKQGIGPDCCVGLCIERTLALTIGLLGILKAGGAYLPLDPAYPKSRRDYMLTDAQTKIILTQKSLMHHFNAQDHQIIVLDSDWAHIAKESPQNPKAMTASNNLAYVIYTSGSTGVPKGVAMPHGPLINLIEWQCAQSTSFGPENCTLQFTSLSFDVAFQEIFATLVTGGRLQIISETQRRDSRALALAVQDSQVERIFLPFVALQQLAEACDNNIELPYVREIITAGEQLQITPSLSRLFTRLPDARLHNQYGPSETHIVTAYAMSSYVEPWPFLPPIGKPLQNITSYILDRYLQMVPLGSVGELYIGGCGIARGYLHRPDATAERFLCDPFSPLAGERMYKTGDSARYLPDGNIEFLGRLDNQVKIRGFRIELGEIEAALYAHKHVQQAIVIVHAQDYLKQLVAYVIPSETDSVTREDLRDYLFQKLPEYMVPALFVFMQTFPLTPSGKIAKSALPLPDQSRPLLATTYAPPNTDQEKALVTIWQEILQIERVGVHDSFFDLGGHSLLLIQLHGRICTTLQQEITLLDLFQYSTIHMLAQHLQKQAQAEQFTADTRDQQRHAGKDRLKQQQLKRRGR